MQISDTELLEDLNRVAEKLGKVGSIVTQQEYKKHGEYGYVTLYRRWPGNFWEATVRAGHRPYLNVPLSETQYHNYMKTSIDADYPSMSLFGVLRGVTGIPTPVLNQISPEWISHLDSTRQPTLFTVPSEHIVSDEDWVMKMPTHYTVAGDTKPTNLKPLLRWLDQTCGRFLTHENTKGGLSTLMEEAGIDPDRRTSALRATVASHLGRRGVSQFEIEMQVGAQKTNWRRSVEDYFLYLYQFEDYCHPDYEPSGVYLDPA